MSKTCSNGYKVGALAGLAAGVIFGLLMSMMGMMGMIAGLVGSTSLFAGWIVHLILSTIIGMTYYWWFGKKTVSYGTGAGFGVLFGFIWFILGPLLIMPILLGMGPQLSAMFASESMPSLMGHIIFGVVTGLLYQYLNSSRILACKK